MSCQNQSRRLLHASDCFTLLSFFTLPPADFLGKPMGTTIATALGACHRHCTTTSRPSEQHNNQTPMKLKMIVSGLLAGGLSCLTASACLIQIRVSCPNDRPGVGVEICLDTGDCATTDEQGIA